MIMNKRYLIRIVTAFLAMVLSDRTDSQECKAILDQNITETLCSDHTEINESENPSEYGISRHNSYSAPARNLQTAKRTSSSGCSLNSFAVKAGKSIDIKSIFHALALCRSDYSGTYAPERLLISLRKLVI